MQRDSNETAVSGRLWGKTRAWIVTDQLEDEVHNCRTQAVTDCEIATSLLGLIIYKILKIPSSDASIVARPMAAPLHSTRAPTSRLFRSTQSLRRRP